jgi:hypothetical protein
MRPKSKRWIRMDAQAKPYGLTRRMLTVFGVDQLENMSDLGREITFIIMRMEHQRCKVKEQ